MDIVDELRQRQTALEGIMRDLALDAVTIVGNSAVGPISYGCFRYFTDHRTYYHLQALVARPSEEMAICVGSILHLDGVRSKGFEDIRLGPDILGSVLSVLSEQKIHRLGVSFEMLPANWELAIKEKFPDMELVDITDDIFALRNVHSNYEIECIKECAKMTDTAYAAVCAMVKPGVRMSDLHAEMDYAMKKAGAEETFTLMTNGVFSYKDNQLPCLQPFSWPDDRIVQNGDCIGMEITPRYKGYWTQLARTVCVGEMNQDLKKAHELQLKAIDFAVEMFKPGARLEAILKALWSFTQEHGYIPKLPFGHIVGLDLDEGGRGSLESKLVIQKGTNFVLHPTMVLDDMDYSIFWGDPYLVTDGGAVRMNDSSTELLVL
ncbi:hypothetical protein CE91St43_20920 [Oscillospiraceae bacterium]|nr:hypothetical protein CE91St43_20920 [Oscillospiraceae bacterium]